MASATTLVLLGSPSGQAGPLVAPQVNDSAAAAATLEEGIAFTGWGSGVYTGPGPKRSLEDLAATGASWISLLVTAYQRNFRARRIDFTSFDTETDAELAGIVTKAHSLGLNVMLKPHLDLSADPDHWRGDIGGGFTSTAQWRNWFRNYRAFIEHYATFAEEHGVDQFSVGCELEGTSHRAGNWRRVVSEVRARYSGPLVYAANGGGEEESLTWWDELDLIGVDAYYDLTAKDEPTAAELAAAWAPHVSDLAALAARWDRTIIFTEIGYRSIDGANRYPWDWQTAGTVDLQEQADCYTAAFDAAWGKPWFGGMFWWDWLPDPNAGGASDTDYTPHDKPAEGVLSARYG